MTLTRSIFDKKSKFLRRSNRNNLNNFFFFHKKSLKLKNEFYFFKNVSKSMVIGGNTLSNFQFLVIFAILSWFRPQVGVLEPGFDCKEVSGVVPAHVPGGSEPVWCIFYFYRPFYRYFYRHVNRTWPWEPYSEIVDFRYQKALSDHFERYFPQIKLVLGCISRVFVHVWGGNRPIWEF